MINRRQMMAASAAAGSALWLPMQRQALAAGPAPKRVIVWYVPEGCAQQAFWRNSGAGALSINASATMTNSDTPQSKDDSINKYRPAKMGGYCLQPLKPYEKEISILSGFRIQGSDEPEPHKKQMNAALTGSKQSQGGIDQWLGDHLKGDSPFASIFSSLFGEIVFVNVDSRYGSPFRSKSGQGGSPTWNPVTTYNQVFPNGIVTAPTGPDHSLLSKLSALGKVKERMNQIRCKGGAEAQARVEAYLTSIERIENQTKGIYENSNMEGVDVKVDIPTDWLKPNNNNKYWQKSDNFGKLVDISIDTTVAALALNRTKSSLITFCGSGNTKGITPDHYRKIGIQGLEPGELSDHHLGHDPDGSRRRNQARIFRWYYSKLAELIAKLKAIPDGEGTLFDSTAIITTSEFGSYNHRDNDPPFIIAGGAGGTFKMGRYFDAYNGGHRTHADLLLAICQGYGMNMNAFGIGTKPYTDILV